jgi:hypothetical protein
MELSGGVVAGRDIHRATTGFSANIDGSLEGKARVVLFAPGCAMVFHVLHKLGGKLRTGCGNVCKKFAAEG